MQYRLSDLEKDFAILEREKEFQRAITETMLRLHTEEDRRIRADLAILGIDADAVIASGRPPEGVQIMTQQHHDWTQLPEPEEPDYSAGIMIKSEYRGIVVDEVLEIDRLPLLQSPFRRRPVVVVHLGSARAADFWCQENFWPRQTVYLASQPDRIRGIRGRIVMVGEPNWGDLGPVQAKRIDESRAIAEYLNRLNGIRTIR